MVSDRLKFLFPITRQVFFQFKKTILEFLFQETRHLNSLNFYQKNNMVLFLQNQQNLFYICAVERLYPKDKT